LLIQNKLYELSPEQQRHFENALLRLRKAEPVQYVRGIADFYGLQFKVTNSVLIPRPETEELVDLIIRKHTNQSVKIVDLGTGSGCIAISLAKNLPKADVTFHRKH
jgi:release factor glutamine methyltransferase